jgi:peptidoglycan-associated lipoprotein
MKTRLCTSIVLSSFLGLLVLFGSGCSKKTVTLPGSGGSTGAGISSGTDINYPPAEGYSEGNLSAEGNLDDTAGSGSTLRDEAWYENQTDEYKRTHGRSSEDLSPIYFEFDQAGITTDMADVMVSNAQYLNSAPNAIVTIQGNCDERGTNEYNLALGERRSMNARQFLVDLGVAPSRIKTLSYGEEKPLFHGQDEEDYEQNRRADFVLQ